MVSAMAITLNSPLIIPAFLPRSFLRNPPGNAAFRLTRKTVTVTIVKAMPVHWCHRNLSLKNATLNAIASAVIAGESRLFTFSPATLKFQSEKKLPPTKPQIAAAESQSKFSRERVATMREIFTE